MCNLTKFLKHFYSHLDTPVEMSDLRQWRQGGVSVLPRLRLGQMTCHLPRYTIVAWMSCNDMTLASLVSLTAWMPRALAMAAASVVM